MEAKQQRARPGGPPPRNSLRAGVAADCVVRCGVPSDRVGQPHRTAKKGFAAARFLVSADVQL